MRWTKLAMVACSCEPNTWEAQEKDPELHIARPCFQKMN